MQVMSDRLPPHRGSCRQLQVWIWFGLASSLAVAVELPVSGPTEIGVYHHDTFAVLLDGELAVDVYAYNRGKESVRWAGEVTNKAGKLVLTGDWQLWVEEVRHGEVLSSTRLHAAESAPVHAYSVKPQGHRNWKWKVPVPELIDHPGLFRLRVRHGGKEAVGRVIRAVTDLATPATVEVTCTPEKAECFVGEPITVTLRVRNNGDDVFLFEHGGDYRGATRQLRYCFTATDAEGHNAVDPCPRQNCMGGLGGPVKLEPGKEWKSDLPLAAYLQFPRPGVYTVTAYQALGFGAPTDVAPKEARAWLGFTYAHGASFELRVREPAQDETTQLIRALFANADEYELRRRFSRLHDSRFLRPLLACLEEENDGQRVEALILGIGSILTPNATQALIGLAGSARASMRAPALEQLARRIPTAPRPGPEEPGRPTQRQDAARKSWQEDFRPTLRPHLLQALRSDQAAAAAAAADCIALFGEPGVVPLLAAAADRFGATPADVATNTNAVRSLARAAYSLSRYGPTTVSADAASSPGRLAVWINAYHVQTARHDAAWEALLLHAMHQDCPWLQHYAIRWLPKNFTRVADIPWRTLLGSPEHYVWWYAVQAAKHRARAQVAPIARELLANTTARSKRDDLRALANAAE